MSGTYDESGVGAGERRSNVRVRVRVEDGLNRRVHSCTQDEESNEEDYLYIDQETEGKGVREVGGGEGGGGRVGRGHETHDVEQRLERAKRRREVACLSVEDSVAGEREWR